jgi:hypothetical protein
MLTGGQPFDGGHLAVADRRHARLAGADRLAFQMYRAGPAQSLATAILRPGEMEMITQHPQQRRVGVRAHGVRLAVNGHSKSHATLLDSTGFAPN